MSEKCLGGVEQLPIRQWAAPEINPCYLPCSEAEKKDQSIEDSSTMQALIDKYSTSKYSQEEWRARNAKVLEGKQLVKVQKLCVETQLAQSSAHFDADNGYAENTERLKARAQIVFKWKTSVENLCRTISDEIVKMEEIRQRLKCSTYNLILCESIVKECLDLRSSRLEYDLVRDEPEEELLKELALIHDLKIIYSKALKSSDQQQKCNIEAKARIEFDWSDKCSAYEADTINIGITRKDQTISLKPEAVKLSDKLSSEVEWENNCKTNMDLCQAMIKKSANLWHSINDLLKNGAHDIRRQADRVDQRLAEKISCTDELRIRLEDELNKQTMKTNASLEGFNGELKKSMRQLELSLKVAQTRLDNRGVLGRPNIEQCRDIPQIGLLEEAQALSQSITKMERGLDEAVLIRKANTEKRMLLEKDIMSKRKCLFIDRDRCTAIRSFYPSLPKLLGYR